MSKNGTQVLLQIANTGGSPASIVGQTTSNLDKTVDMIETTVKSSPSRAKTYEAGEIGGTLSCESQTKNDEGTALVALNTAADAGTVQDFVLTSGVVGDIEFSGTALISSLSIGAPQNDVRTISYSLQITGPVTAAVIAI